MKKILVASTIALAVFGFTGCFGEEKAGHDAKAGEKTSKCGEGKCGEGKCGGDK